MIRGRNLIWQLPLLLLLLLPLSWEAVARFLNPAGGADFGQEAVPPRESLTMEGVTFRQNRAGVSEWRLAAATVSGRDEQRLFLFGEPRLRLLGRGGGEDWVAGREAVYDTVRESISFAGQVRVATGEGYLLRAPELQYLLAEKRLRTESEIIFTGPDLRIAGVAFSYDLESGDFAVGRQVACELW